MKILIPSFHRVELQSTLKLLSGPYFPKSDLIVSTQCKDDYIAYSRKYSDKATIIYQEGDSVGDNRNTLLEYCSSNGIDRAVFLDDDITGFRFIGGRAERDPKRIKAIFEKCMQLAEKNNASLWGAYTSNNVLCFTNTITKNIFTGTCFGVLDTSLRFDSKFRVKEDFELCLRVLSRGGNVLRFNMFAPSARHKTKGGCEQDWNDTKHYGRYADILVAAYPEYVQYGKKTGEIKFIAK